MSIISDPPTDSINGKQLTAALALAKLLEHELPALHWHIWQSDGRLLGTFSLTYGEADRRNGFDDWAKFLGAETKVKTDPGMPDGVVLEATATYRNAKVTIIASVEATAEEKAEASA